MITKKKIHYIQDLQKIQELSVACPDDVGIHSVDGTTIIDAKSYIGMYALDFSQPILIVSENKAIHAALVNVGEDVLE